MIGEQAAISDTGRVRRTNEDSLLVMDGLFVVADGMGGARGGEVASAIAVATISELAAGDGDPGVRLRDAIVEANRRVHARAQEDPSVAGMGSTVTAVTVAGDALAFAHVGDSRAYLLRDGVLQQLSDDHSLVGELVRRGALTAEEAERHPQRSIITRALGAEPSVDVDTWTIEPRDGDLYLLCSDGLSGMVTDDTLREILSRPGPLRRTGEALIAAANAAGGEDNITAVLFRVGDPPTDEPTDDRPTATMARAPTATLVRPAEAPVTPVAGVPGDRAATAPPVLRLDAPAAPRRGRLRRLVLPLVAVLVGLGAAAAVLAGLSWAHFVGEADGRVAVFQGVPVDVGGVRLYREVERSDIPVAELDQTTRRDLFDHSLESRDDADAAVEALRQTRIWEPGIATPVESPAAGTETSGSEPGAGTTTGGGATTS